MPQHNPRILYKTPTHTYITPHPLLAPYIAHYTFCFQTLSPEARLPQNLTLIPDASGCIVSTFNGHHLTNLFWGPTTKTVTVHGDIDHAPLRFFVEFLPCGANRLMGLSLKDFTNHRTPLSFLQPNLDQCIIESFETSTEMASLCHCLDTLFLEKLSNIVPGSSTAPLIQILTTFPSLKAFSEKIGYSERQVQRLFSETLGLSYKTYVRLTRINRALKIMDEKPIPFTTLSQTLGYYDQSHFIHDFKTICGETPTSYTSKMSDFYNETFKF